MNRQRLKQWCDAIGVERERTDTPETLAGFLFTPEDKINDIRDRRAEMNDFRLIWKWLSVSLEQSMSPQEATEARLTLLVKDSV